jgi:predicted nucleotidyltransferase
MVDFGSIMGIAKHPASGRFLLRISPELHEDLRRSAAQAGLSLNDHCARRLGAPAGVLDAWPAAADAVRRCAALFPDRLLGVVLFGSQARGDVHDASDADLLIVLESSSPITRELYRRWDEARVTWGGRSVEPHFVHLPDEERTVAGLWAEVALDGIVLHARSATLPVRLARVRRDIASGRIVRRTIHGQPYWVGAA